MTRKESVATSSRTSWDRWFALGVSLLLTVGAAWGQAPEDDVPANVRYLTAKSRMKLKPRIASRGYRPGDVKDAAVQGWIRVKFRDGTVVKVEDGELVSPDLDSWGLGLGGAIWQPAWSGTREGRTELWRKTEKATGRRLSDPTTYYLVRLPASLSLSEAMRKLAGSEVVEAMWPVPELSRGPRWNGLPTDSKPPEKALATPLDAWRRFGITGRLSGLYYVDIAAPLPNAGFQLPPYTVVTGAPFQGAGLNEELYAASVLSYLGAPLDETLQAGFAPHSTFRLAYWNVLGTSTHPGKWIFDPAQTLEVLVGAGGGPLIGAGDVLLLNWCMDTIATGNGQYLGCLPLESDLQTYEAILTLSVGLNVAVVEWAGWVTDAQGNILPWSLDGISLPDFPTGCSPLNYCLDSQALVIGWINDSGVAFGNTGIRVDEHVPEGAPRVAGVGALAQSAVRHIGISTRSNADVSANGAVLRVFSVGDPVRTLDGLLQAANTRSASLRVHGPLTGFGPISVPSQQNVAIIDGATVTLPEVVARTGVLQFPFEIFNDGRGTLNLDATIQYDSDSNPTSESQFSFEPSAMVPSSLGPRQGQEFIVNFEPRYAGDYRADVEINSNDSLAQPFRFTLEATVTGQTGLKWALLDVNDAVLPDDRLDFDQVDWSPLPRPLNGVEPELKNPPDIHPSRVIKIKNFGGEAIEVKVDVPGASYHCHLDDTGLGRPQNDRPILAAGFHFMNVQPGCPEARNTLRFVIGGGETETVGFEFIPHEVGTFTSPVTFRAKRYGTTDEEEVLTVTLAGTVENWPEALKLVGCDGRTYDIPLGGSFTWDLGAVRYQEVVHPDLFELYSRVKGYLSKATKVGGVLGDEAPVDIKFVNRVMGYLEAAEIVIELENDAETVFGRLVKKWQVEVDLDPPTGTQTFFFSYSMRPFVDRGATTYTLRRPGERVNITPDTTSNRCGYGENKSATVGAKILGENIPPGYVHDFGSAAPGESVTETYTLTNTSSTNSLEIEGFLVEGDAFRGSVADTSLGPGESTDFTVTFQSAAPGNYQGWVSFKVNSPGEVSPFWIGRLVGEVTKPVQPTPVIAGPGGEVLSNGDRYTFPVEIERNGPGVSRRFTITNGGQQTLQISNLRMFGDGMYLSEGNGLSATLGSEDSASFEVTMETSPAGNKSGTLLFDTNATPSSWGIDFRGLVTEPDLSGLRVERLDTGEAIVSGSTVSMPDVVAHEFYEIPIRVTNDNPTARIRPNFARWTDHFCLCMVDGYAYSSEGIPPGGSEPYRLIFSPEHPGDLEWRPILNPWIEVEGIWRNLPDFYLTVVGTALESPGDDRLRIEDDGGATLLNGSELVLGQGRQYERLETEVRITNVGGENVYLGAIKASDEAFVVEVPDSGHLIHGELPPGDFVTVRVWLQRPTAGIYEGFLFSEAFDLRLKAVVGDGVVLELDDGTRIAPGGFLDFPRVTVPEVTGANVAIRNLGFADVTLGDVAVAGDGAFRITSLPGPQTLAPGAQVTVALELDGSTAGAHAAELQVPLARLDGTDASLAARLRGWVSPSSDPSPLLEVSSSSDWESPSLLWHGDRLAEKEIGASTAEGLTAPSTGGGVARFVASWILSLRNGGDAPLEIVDLETSSPYLEARIYDETTLAPGETKSLYVSFVSDQPGRYLESLSILTDDPFSPLTLEVPVVVPERSVLEVRWPYGGLSSGAEINVGTLPRILGSFGWNIPVWLRNTGREDLYLSRIGIDFAESSPHLIYAPYPDPDRMQRLEPGRSIPIGIRVLPWAEGAIHGTLTIGSSDRGQETFVLHVRGRVKTGVQAMTPILEARYGGKSLFSGGPRTELGTFRSGVSSVRLTLANLAESYLGVDADLEIEDVVVEGNGWSFGGLSRSTLGGQAIADLYLDLTADEPGWYDGRVTIRNNSPVDPYVINMRGVVLADGPLAKVHDIRETDIPRQGTYQFPDVRVATTASRAFFVYNGGNYPLRIDEDGIRVEGDGFSLVAQPDPPVVIEPDQRALFRVRFRRPATGSYTGQVTFSTNEGSGPYVFQLAANVVDGVTDPLETAPELHVFRNWDDVELAAGGVVAYGEIPTGQPVSRRFRIENHGSEDLDLSLPVVSGPCASLVEQLDLTVAAGDVTYFRVRLQCGAAGPASGTVSIASDDPASPFVFTVSADVVDLVPILGVSQAWDGVPVANGGVFDFGETTPAGDPMSRRFRIDNSGEAELVIANPADLVSGTCFHLIEEPDATVPIGGTTYFRVRVLCATAGTYTGQVTIASNDPLSGGSYGFSVIGTVEERVPEIAVFQAWDGAPVAAGSTFTYPESPPAGKAVSRRFRIDNPGTADLALASPLALVGGACFSQIEDPPATVPAGGSAYFRVRLACSEPGPKSGTVTIAAATGSVPAYAFSLAGSVLDPDPLIQVRQGWDGVALGPGGTALVPGSFTLEETAVAGSFFLDNPGTEPLEILNPGGLLGGVCFQPDPATAVPSTLPAGGSVEVPIRVYCSTPGVVQGELRVSTSRDGVTADGYFSAALQATVIEPELRVARGWPGADPAELAGGDSVTLPIVAGAGDASTSVAFQIYNDGQGDLFVQNVGPAIVAGECFSIRAGGYPDATVPAGGSTPFRVWWGETCAPGEYTATITVASNDADEDPLVFTVVGQVEPPPPVVEVVQNWDLAPVADGSTIDFPNAVSLDVVSSAAFQLTNPLSEALAFDPSSGVTGDCFSITPGEPIPASLSAGASAIFRVRVLCDSAGEKLGTVTLATSTAAQTHAPFTFTLRAVVDPPEIRVVRGWPGADPSEISSGQVIDLPTVAVAGDTNHSAAFQIHNSGAGTLVIENPDASLVSGTCMSTRYGGFPVPSVDPGDFTPFRVWWGGSCTEPGDYTATVSILSNDPDEDPLTFQVRGTVVAVPVLTCQPSDARVVAGQTASFSVCVAQPNGTLTYSWLKDGQPIAGAGATLSLSAVADADEGTYSVRVANEAGSVDSSPATLTVVEKPVVSRPVNQTVSEGGTATFSVTVSSPAEDGPFGYFWQQLPPGASAYQTIPGATSATLHVANVTAAMSGTRYRCLVGNDAGQTNSGYGTLTVATSDVAVTRAWDGGAVGEGSTFDFGTAERNVAKSYLFRITNTGQGTLTIANPTTLVSGTCFSEIEYAASSVAPGGSTTFRVRLYCGSAGTKTGTISIYSNDPSSPYTFYVRGTVVASDVLVQQAWDNATVGANSTQSFGSVETGVATSKRYRITNTGQATLTIGNPTSLVSGTCWSLIENAASTVAPGASTYFRVRLLCSSTGTKSGTVTINSNDPTSPYRFYVTGTVTAPDPGNAIVYHAWENVVQSEGTTFTYPGTTTGTAVSRRFRITNTGTGTLTISNPTSLVSGTCWSQIENAASTVAPGGSTYFRVRLLCSSTGTKTGTLTINSNDPSSPYRFYVQGTVN